MIYRIWRRNQGQERVKTRKESIDRLPVLADKRLNKCLFLSVPSLKLRQDENSITTPDPKIKGQLLPAVDKGKDLDALVTEIQTKIHSQHRTIAAMPSSASPLLDATYTSSDSFSFPLTNFQLALVPHMLRDSNFLSWMHQHALHYVAPGSFMHSENSNVFLQYKFSVFFCHRSNGFLPPHRVQRHYRKYQELPLPLSSN